MDATSEANVVDRLRQQGYLPVDAHLVSSRERRAGISVNLFRRRLTIRQFELIARTLARLVSAGIRLERAFQILIETSEDRAARQFLSEILGKLRSGTTLASAIAGNGPPITRLHVSIVEAGESAGLLHITLNHLADYLAKSRAFRSNLISALSYPMLVLVVAAISIALLLIKVVPEFGALFEGETEIPAITKGVIAASNWLLGSWSQLLIGIAGVLGGLLLAGRLPAFKRFIDGQILNTSVIGGLVRRVQVARFCRLLATLLANGVQLTSALPIVAGSLTNTQMERSILPVIETVRSGGGLANGLEKAGSFPALAVQMVKVGEESAQLDGVLLELAELYEDEIAQYIKNMLRILEPTLIVVLGGAVGLVIAATYLGILSVNDIVF